MLRVVNKAFDHPLESEEKSAMPFAGGVMQHGYQCGMVWGATLAAGAEAHRRFGPGPKAETSAVVAAKRLVEAFRSRTGEINCLEITDVDKSSSAMKMIYVFLIKGGTIGCMRLSANYSKTALGEIVSALSAEDIEAVSTPVSCAAELARKAGLSDMHVAMASGLAGGIGLSGGACGALGTAIWIMAMKNLEQGAAKLDFKSAEGLAVIDRFLKCTDYKFECSEIVGREFESVQDHADYLRDRGCAKLIETLAAG